MLCCDLMAHWWWNGDIPLFAYAVKRVLGALFRRIISRAKFSLYSWFLSRWGLPYFALIPPISCMYEHISIMSFFDLPRHARCYFERSTQSRLRVDTTWARRHACSQLHFTNTKDNFIRWLPSHDTSALLHWWLLKSHSWRFMHGATLFGDIYKRLFILRYLALRIIFWGWFNGLHECWHEMLHYRSRHDALPHKYRMRFIMPTHSGDTAMMVWGPQCFSATNYHFSSFLSSNKRMTTAWCHSREAYSGNFMLDMRLQSY